MHDTLCISATSTEQPGLPAKHASRHGLAKLWSNIVAWQACTRFRWELKRLAKDNPYLIDDIGLTKEQVEEEIAKLPFWQR